MTRNFLTSSRHGTVFYYRRRVPDDLRPIIGKPYLVKTLKTSDRREAIILARAYVGRTDEIFGQVRTMKKNKPDALQADNSMTFDGATKDPMAQAIRDALIGFMAALSQAQAEVTKEAQKAGIANVKVAPNPLKPKTYLGRKPTFTAGRIGEIIALIGEGNSVTQVAKHLCLSQATIYRIQKNPGYAYASSLSDLKSY